jgi:hypothetical protein
MEIMWIHNGFGSSTTILTGANVIDIVPSKLLMTIGYMH